jgi:DNA polymerase sigma
MAVKHWAQDCKINSAKDNHLSSYAWMNLVVFYLQCIRLLPNLQCCALMKATGLKPDPSNEYWHFVNDLDTCTLLWENIKKKNSWSMPQDLAEEPVSLLLYGFFEFYAVRFPYTTFAVSIKSASISLPKLAARRVKHFYSIEDPFETYDSHCPHDLGKPASEFGARKIINCFRDSEEDFRLIMSGNKSAGQRSKWLKKFLGLETMRAPQRTKTNQRTTGESTKLQCHGPDAAEKSMQSVNTKMATMDIDQLSIDSGTRHTFPAPLQKDTAKQADEENVPTNNSRSVNPRRRNRPKKKEGVHNVSRGGAALPVTQSQGQESPSKLPNHQINHQDEGTSKRDAIGSRHNNAGRRGGQGRGRDDLDSKQGSGRQHGRRGAGRGGQDAGRGGRGGRGRFQRERDSELATSTEKSSG